MTLEETISYALEEDVAGGGYSLPRLRTSEKSCSPTGGMTAMLSPCHLITVMIDDTTQRATRRNGEQLSAKKTALISRFCNV